MIYYCFLLFFLIPCYPFLILLSSSSFSPSLPPFPAPFPPFFSLTSFSLSPSCSLWVSRDSSVSAFHCILNLSPFFFWVRIFGKVSFNISPDSKHGSWLLQSYFLWSENISSWSKVQKTQEGHEISNTKFPHKVLKIYWGLGRFFNGATCKLGRGPQGFQTVTHVDVFICLFYYCFDSLILDHISISNFSIVAWILIGLDK